MNTLKPYWLSTLEEGQDNIKSLKSVTNGITQHARSHGLNYRIQANKSGSNIDYFPQVPPSGGSEPPKPVKPARKVSTTLEPPVQIPPPSASSGGGKKQKKKFARHKIRSESPDNLIKDLEDPAETQVIQSFVFF